MKKVTFTLIAVIAIALFSCTKNGGASNSLTGNYILVKNRLHIQQNAHDYYDSITANLGYLNLSSNGMAYLKSTWGYTTSTLNNILVDTPHLYIDSFNYSVINSNTVYLYKNNVPVDTLVINNNQFFVHQVFSTSPINEAWSYFSK